METNPGDPLAPATDHPDDGSSTTLLCIVERDDPDGVRRLTLTGELDLSSAPELQRRLRELESCRRAVRLDMSQLDFIDSTGVSSIIAGLRQADHDGWSLEVDPDIRGQVARLIRLVGLDRVLWPAD